MSDFLTAEEISIKTGISRRTLYRWIERGIVLKGEKTRRDDFGGVVSVWPVRVVAHIENCQRLVSQKVPLARLPRMT